MNWALIGAAVFGTLIGAMLLAFLLALKKKGVSPAGLAEHLISREGRDSKMAPCHIIFCMADHFEPGAGSASTQQAIARSEAWHRGYPELVRGHKDWEGLPPQHTWFFPPHYFYPEHLFLLGSLAYQGLGEVELHLHHQKDTADSLRKKLEEAVSLYNEYGALITAEPVPRRVYGFIHGDWGLGNSRGSEYCGVNNELSVLRESGCYADFTMPSLGQAQPRMTNAIYYARDDPARPKSYDTGSPVTRGAGKQGDLMLIQGPLLINWRDWHHRFYPALEAGEISFGTPPSPQRVDAWVRAGVAVKGMPRWIFVKVHCHGAIEAEQKVVLGPRCGEMFTYLGSRYNDGSRYRLHYVTAREAYNLVKAAEAGADGDPGPYRDYLIPPYANRMIRVNQPFRLLSFASDSVGLEVLAPSPDCSIEFKGLALRQVEGEVSFLSFSDDSKSGEIILSLHGKDGAKIVLALPGELRGVGGARVAKVGRDRGGGSSVLLHGEMEPSGKREVRVFYEPPSALRSSVAAEV